MIADLIRFELPRLAHLGRRLSPRDLRAPPSYLVAVLVAGLGLGIMASGHFTVAARHQASQITAAPKPSATNANAAISKSNPSDALAMATPAEGLKISSQSWRRGGLGSKAMVTLTLRNDNDYAVGDIGLLCSFSSPDGSMVTERRPTIHDSIKPKSRKTFSRVHAGFVNVVASRATCSLVSARPV